MRKFILLSFIGILIVAFGTSVYAQKKEEPKLEFKASGFINAISFWTQNIPGLNSSSKIYGGPSTYVTPDSGAYDKKVGYMDARAHLKFDAMMGKEASGTIYFEIDSTRWGDVPGGQGAKLSERGTFGYWSGDRAAVEVKNIYFDFAIPYFGIPAPMTARVGLQPLSIRPNIFVYTDGMGISGGIKADPVLIQPMWYKALEGSDEVADDVDVYGLHMNAKVDSFTIGGYALYYNMNSYPFFLSQTQTLTNAAGTAVDVVLPSSLNKLTQGTQQADMWWFGVYADGKAGPLNFNLDLVMDRGKVESRLSNVDDVKYRGWAGRIKVDYPWEQFNFGVGGVYGSGSDKEKHPNVDGFADGTNDKVGSYVIPVGSESPAISGDSVFLSIHAGSTGGIGWAATHNYNQMTRGPMGGLWWGKLYGSYKLTPEYKVTLQGLYIGDTTKNGNTWGTARKADGVTYRDDKDIGWEIDLLNEIQIYKSLKFEIALGMLFAGDAMDFNVSGANNDSPRNPWGVTTRLTYTF
jgi:hypothetical protein